MNPPGRPLPEELGHLAGLDVLVRVLRVIRGEELSQFVPHVVDELAEGAQPGENDQVPGVDPLPQVGCWNVWIGEKGWHSIIPQNACIRSISGRLASCR